MSVNKRIRYYIGIVIIVWSVGFCARGASGAAPSSQAGNTAIEQYTINEGSPTMFGVNFGIDRANIGEGIIGVVIGSNPDSPVYALFQGFSFIQLYVPPLPDYQYDIDEVFSEEFSGGVSVPEAAWQTDSDPFFYWTLKTVGLPVLGYSVAFNEYPDEFVDVIDAEYQTPEFYLEDGKHAFYVVAKNTDGNFGNWGSFDVWVDTARPQISNTLPENATTISSARPAIQAVLFDATSGIDISTIKFTVTTTLDEYIVSGDYDSDTGAVVFVPGFDLEEGAVTVRLEVSDLAGNEAVPSFWNFTIATTAPEGWVVINGDSPVTETPEVTLNLFAADIIVAVTEMMISLDGVFDSEVWVPYETTVENYAIPAISGTRTVYVKFRDSAGNESIVYSDTIVLLLDVPNTFITESPQSITADIAAAFSFTSTIATSSFQYKIDNQAWTAFGSDVTAFFSGLEVGNHYFQVRSGLDLDNNGTIDPDEIDPSPAVVSWTVGSVSTVPIETKQPIRYYKKD